MSRNEIVVRTTLGDIEVACFQCSRGVWVAVAEPSRWIDGEDTTRLDFLRELFTTGEWDIAYAQAGWCGWSAGYDHHAAVSALAFHLDQLDGGERRKAAEATRALAEEVATLNDWRLAHPDVRVLMYQLPDRNAWRMTFDSQGHTTEHDVTGDFWVQALPAVRTAILDAMYAAHLDELGRA